MMVTVSAGLDALPVNAQRPFVARCVAFACAFLERGECFFPESAVLAAFRRDFGSELRSISAKLWEKLPQSDKAAALRHRLNLLLDAQIDLPSEVDHIDGYTDSAIYVVLAACNWLLREGNASRISRELVNMLDQVAGQEALSNAGTTVMLAKEVDCSPWVDPELTWQAHYIDRAHNGKLEEIERLAENSAQTLIKELIPRINAVVVRSRS